MTGATGQVGSAVIAALCGVEGINVRAAVRDVASATRKWCGEGNVQRVGFDFLDRASQNAALAGCDSLFLLRPPQLNSDFGGLITRARQHGVTHIVFLSVQGAERNPFIPHHKIERRLMSCGVPFTLLRPAYFMQNFTSTLQDELVRRYCIFLPAGKARFTLVDVGDIARVAVMLLLHLLPRLKATPLVTHTVADLTGRVPTEFAQFVAAHCDELLTPPARP